MDVGGERRVRYDACGELMPVWSGDGDAAEAERRAGLEEAYGAGRARGRYAHGAVAARAQEKEVGGGGGGGGEGEGEALSPTTLQVRVREIAADGGLSEAEKNRRRQGLFSGGYDVGLERAGGRARAAFVEDGFEAVYSGVGDGEGGVLLGCEHYARKCKLKAACCGVYVGCRICHEKLGHAMDRYKTARVACMECRTEQDVGEGCGGCGVRFARYYCGVCKFYDDTPGKAIYHCDDCGICRVGEGLGKDNFHCTKCNACITMDTKDNHCCMKMSLECDCPICGEYLFTSTRPVVYMRCGHTMHMNCRFVVVVAFILCVDYLKAGGGPPGALCAGLGLFVVDFLLTTETRFIILFFVWHRL